MPGEPMQGRNGGSGRTGGQSRRGFLKAMGIAVPAALALRSRPATAATERVLAFHNTHTAEKLEVAYWRDGGYDEAALRAVNHVLRDFRTGDVHPIEPGLLDILHTVQTTLRRELPFHIISGYRAPATNAQLRAKSHGGVAQYSLHMDGRAIDVRLPGVRTATLREVAAKLALGGVGYYPGDDFVHLDTGRPRTW